MLKLLITGLFIYFVYRFFIAPPALGNRSGQDHLDRQPPHGRGQTPDHDGGGEYIDYEEVD